MDASCRRRTTIDGRDRDPVVQVGYEDALAFAKWKGKALPSEEQWELAAATGGADRAHLPVRDTDVAAIGDVDRRAAMLHLHLMRVTGDGGTEQQPGDDDDAHVSSPCGVPNHPAR